MTKTSLLHMLARRQPVDTPGRVESVESHVALIDDVDLDEFLATASQGNDAELNDILQRAISFALQSGNQSAEVSFLSLSAALESALTFFRRQDEYEILGAEAFSEVERDLKKWLKQHPALANEPAKRGLDLRKGPGAEPLSSLNRLQEIPRTLFVRLERPLARNRKARRLAVDGGPASTGPRRPVPQSSGGGPGLRGNALALGRRTNATLCAGLAD